MTAVTVHLGLAKTGTTTLQTQYFSKAPEIAYLGKKTGDEVLDEAGRRLTRLYAHEIDLDDMKATFDARLAEATGVPLFSDEDLSVWKFLPPAEMGRRVGEVFPYPRLLYVVRKPTEWIKSQYYFRLSTYRRDTFAGPNSWMEKHLSQFKVGSDLAEITFTHTLDAFARAANATQTLVLPYEMMLADEAAFLTRIEDYLGVPGALNRIREAGEVETKKPRLNRLQANYIRTLSLFSKDRERFLELAAIFAKRGRRDVSGAFADMAANPDTTLDEWATWFRKAQRTTFKALAEGDEEVAKALDLFNDYEIRAGLMAHAFDVEREEAEIMRERHGVDLSVWGYGGAAGNRGGVILASVTPKLDAYLGREVPKRLTIRPYNEIAMTADFHPNVEWRRADETFEAAAAGGYEPAPLHIDAWTRGAKRFSHWLFDLWPKLVAARRAGLTLERVIVTDNPAPFVDETLSALSLTRKDLIGVGKGGLTLERASVWRLGDTRAGMWTPPWIIEAVRGAFLPSGDGPGGRRLYISRNRAERRRTINEDEVLAVLTPRGFETVYLEELGLKQAAALINQAEVIVSPHGAGLANMVFCRPGCRIVEYFSWHISQEYWLLANALDLPYACIEGEGTDGRRHFEMTAHEKKTRDIFSPEDIRVPIAELKRALDGL